MGASAPGGPHVDDTQAWEDSATAGAVAGRVHGGPMTNPIFFPLWPLHSICSNGTTRPRGKTLRRRAPSPGTFIARDPSGSEHRSAARRLEAAAPRERRVQEVAGACGHERLAVDHSRRWRGGARPGPARWAWSSARSADSWGPAIPSNAPVPRDGGWPTAKCTTAWSRRCAWEDAATAGAVAGHVHGGPITNPIFFLSGLLQSFLAFFSPLALEQSAREPDLFPFWPSSIHCLEQSARA